jgi:hypothetical protein
MATDNFCFYLQNRLIQTSQTGGQGYSDTSPLSIPWLTILIPPLQLVFLDLGQANSTEVSPTQNVNKAEEPISLLTFK